MYASSFTPALERWLRATHGSEAIGIASVQRLVGGFSNETVVLTLSGTRAGQPQRLVLRWDPGDGPLAPYDMPRQYLIMAALRDTNVPVPEAYALETNPAVIGHAFYTVEYVADAATPIAGRARILAARQPQERAAKLADYVHVLASIHAVDWRAHGMDWLQTCSAAGLIDAKLAEQREYLHRANVSYDPVVDEAFAWLEASAPARPELALVHGDASLANFLYRGDRIVAVLDWELASLSDPLEDIGLSVGLLPVEQSDISRRQRDRDREDILRLYHERTGRTFSDLPFWTVFSWVRCVGIFANFESYTGQRAPLYDPVVLQIKNAIS
jgi:aminoglycoside phosphotransferase (APT) family kinase protein